MATAKKPAVKKTTKAASTRKAPVKKTAVKSTATKKPVAKKVATKPTAVKSSASTAKKAPAKRKVVKKSAAMRSFHVAQDSPPFNSFKITRQTVYWLILICVIIFAQLWILKVQYEVLELLDQQLLEVAFL